MSAECKKRQTNRLWVRRLISYSALSTQLSALLFLSACAIPIVPYRAVYEDPVNYVRLEVDDSVLLPEWPPSAHAHPKAMRAEDVARILGGISVKEHRIWLQKWWQGEASLDAGISSGGTGTLVSSRSQRPLPRPNRTNV